MDDNEEASNETPCDNSGNRGDEKLTEITDENAAGDQCKSDTSSCLMQENTSQEEAAVEKDAEKSVAADTKENMSSIEPVLDASKDDLPDNLSRYRDVAEQLATGCLKEHLPHIQQSKEQITQLTESQRVLIETMQQENQKFGECQTLTDVTDIMDKAKFYLDKLTKIKKEMFALHEKSAKLKRRALKIQQEKMKEELQREHQKEREFEKDRQLIAQPVRKADIKASTNACSETSDTKTSQSTTDTSSTKATGSDTLSASASNVT